MELSAVTKRNALAPRREPYWSIEATGRAVGFRKINAASVGTWIARAYDPDTRRNRYMALGDFADLEPRERYAAAVKAANAWFKHLDANGLPDVLTVRQACDAYVETIKASKGATKAADAAARFARYVYPDKIAKVELLKLRKADLIEWRQRLAKRPALVKRGKGKDATVATRERSPGTVNRDMVPLRAALNLAFEHGQIDSDSAWRVALKPAPHSKRRGHYLDRTQRRALLDKLPDDLAAFVRGLCLLPVRPGALATLCVADFNARTRELKIGKDKAGGNRSILLPADTAKLLADQSRGKLPRSPLFSRWDGKAWDKDAWKKPLKAAADAAGLPVETTAYTLRHSVITDLVKGGLDLFTVATISGTSVAMIERHYGHLQKEHAAKALSTLAI